MIVTIYLLKHKKTKREHLIYVIDNALLIDPTFEGLSFWNAEDIKYYYKLFDFIDFKVKEVEKKKKPYMKLSFYNCISTGKHLLGMSGLYFTPHSFFNKIR